jgi:hypothetical protein
LKLASQEFLPQGSAIHPCDLNFSALRQPVKVGEFRIKVDVSSEGLVAIADHEQAN